MNPYLVYDDNGEPVRTWLIRPGKPPLLTFVWKDSELATQDERQDSK
jgi:hypothetical protein